MRCNTNDLVSAQCFAVVRDYNSKLATRLKAMQFNFAASQNNAILRNSHVLHFKVPAATNASIMECNVMH